MNVLKKATLSGTVTLMQKNDNTGVCEFLNLLSVDDKAAWISTNMRTTETVSLLEDLSRKYKVFGRAHGFEITFEEAYFEFSFNRLNEVQEELQELGVTVEKNISKKLSPF